MRLYSSTIFKETLAVVVISHGIFLTGFTYSFGQVVTKKESLTQEGFSSFKDSALNSIGCLLSAYTIEILGRKRTIQICFLSFFCAGFVFLLNDSTVVTSVSHAVTAVSLGAKPVFIIYVLEVSQKNHRGMFISFYLIFGSFGFASSYVLQYYLQLKTLAAVSIFIAVAGFCGTSLLPDTKYWYFMNNEIDKAKDSSSWFNSSQTKDDIDKEMDRIRKNREESGLNRYQNFLVATALLICRAGSGKVVFALYPFNYYLFFEKGFLELPLPLMHDLAAFVLTVAFTAIIDQFKRRHLLYFSTLTAVLALTIVLIIDFVFSLDSVANTIVQPIFLLLYGAIVDGFLEGLITILSAEMISAYNKRGALLNVSYFCCFLTQILYALSFPYMLNYFDVNFVLITFLINDFIILALNFFCVPETSNKDLDEFGLFLTSI